MKRIAWDEAATAEENARARLPEAVAAYFAEGRQLAAGNPPAAELHAFRLTTKRVRYTLEMFQPVYGQALEKHLKALRQVQTMLGEINDCAATRARLDAALDAASEEREKVDRFIDAREAALTSEFLKFWREEFDAGSNEARWREFLAGAPPRKKKPAAKKKTATARRRKAPARAS